MTSVFQDKENAVTSSAWTAKGVPRTPLMTKGPRPAKSKVDLAFVTPKERRVPLGGLDTNVRPRLGSVGGKSGKPGSSRRKQRLETPAAQARPVGATKTKPAVREEEPAEIEYMPPRPAELPFIPDDFERPDYGRLQSALRDSVVAAVLATSPVLAVSDDLPGPISDDLPPLLPVDAPSQAATVRPRRDGKENRPPTRVRGSRRAEAPAEPAAAIQPEPRPVRERRLGYMAPTSAFQAKTRAPRRPLAPATQKAVDDAQSLRAFGTVGRSAGRAVAASLAAGRPASAAPRPRAPLRLDAVFDLDIDSLVLPELDLEPLDELLDEPPAPATAAELLAQADSSSASISPLLLADHDASSALSELDLADGSTPASTPASSPPAAGRAASADPALDVRVERPAGDLPADSYMFQLFGGLDLESDHFELRDL
ncbi:uncharacterized protein V1510DRAFT_412844 [Dipodascopsis tothii]|uniref:uncharacterized protein n=1 Tax=Dipodascopsis tothii TaxID=44089 RepID=UPI0034CDCC78